MTKILDIYPDEHLVNRPVFEDAFMTGEISLAALRKECDVLLIPWQLFLLSPDKLVASIQKIEERRKSKFSERLIANRSNDGSGISLRIADRIIGLQEFASEGIDTDNTFCGMLNNYRRSQWPLLIIQHFGFDLSRLNNKPKDGTLKYIIRQVESKNIRVARGVLSSAVKFFPAAKEVQKTYRKSSGFVVHDEKLPYVFLPDEMGDNETPGRQILTLVVLLVLVGTNNYDLYLTSDLELHVKRAGILRQAFGVATDILLPYEATDKYKDVVITETIRDELAASYMLTPSAVVVTLRQRGIIDSDEQQAALLDSIEGGVKGTGPRKAPKIDTAVKKMCGDATTTDIIRAISAGSLTTVNAQYLMFGRVDKIKYATFAATVGL